MKIEITPNEYNIIMQSLLEMPAKTVINVINTLHEQIKHTQEFYNNKETQTPNQIK